MIEIPVWVITGMFGTMLALQGWTLSSIVELKTKVAALEKAETYLNKK